MLSSSCYDMVFTIFRTLYSDAVDYYSVVLLTDDRNLRVKALASGLPAKDLPNFMKLLTPFSTKS